MSSVRVESHGLVCLRQVRAATEQELLPFGVSYESPWKVERAAAFAARMVIVNEIERLAEVPAGQPIPIYNTEPSKVLALDGRARLFCPGDLRTLSVAIDAALQLTDETAVGAFARRNHKEHVDER